MMYSDKNLIIAKASATGQGGIGVVRISGSSQDVETLIGMIFPTKVLKPRYATLLPFYDQAGQLIDRVIALRFVSPASYTGEDVLEIQAHGGTAVLQMIVDRCLELGRSIGLRLAQPGEFSQRAFLNGKMDLAQAEGVADLISASSQAAARAAARSMQGEFSKRVHAVNDKMIELRAYIEATMDFPEEEIDFIQNGHVEEKIEEIAVMLEQLEKSAMRGKVLRDGLTVVLVGPPNVGKSSIMNALAGEEVAIVTDVAGTTRDKITFSIQLDGMMINLIDTAGVRKTDDKVEKIGIERTLKAVEDADVVLHLRSPEHSGDQDDLHALEMIRQRLREGVVFLSVCNKMDLSEAQKAFSDSDSIKVSAKTGMGIEKLIAKLKELSGMTQESQGDFLARSRHLDCLARTMEHLSVLRHQKIGNGLGLDIVAEELRLASMDLGEIVGNTVADDLLGMIFSKFCIGK